MRSIHFPVDPAASHSATVMPVRTDRLGTYCRNNCSGWNPIARSSNSIDETGDGVRDGASFTRP
jgi:hypothetical protein